MADPDRVTVDQARRGDPRALQRLVELHGLVLQRLARRIVGDPHDAEDVVQETFLRALRGLHRFNGESTFRTWITRIALNSCMTMLSERSRVPTGLVGETEHLDGERPDDALLNEEFHSRITQAMDTLTPMERTAWVLRHEEGTPIAEVSRLLGVNDEAARQSIFRAARKLRRYLRPARRDTR